MNRGFLAIGIVLLLLSSLYIAFTIGFLLFGWGAQYRYDLFYFPSPIVSTVDSLTSTGRMVSIALPIVAVSSLLLAALAIRIPSPKMISIERQRPASLPGVPSLKGFPAGILAAPATEGVDFGSSTPVLEGSVKHDLLYRLFPYERQGVAVGRAQVKVKPGHRAGEGQTGSHLWLVGDVINNNIS